MNTLEFASPLPRERRREPISLPTDRLWTVHQAAALIVEGRLEKYDGVTSVKGGRFWSLQDALTLPSRDFR